MPITTEQQQQIETLRNKLTSAGIVATAKTAKRAALGEATLDTALFGGCLAEDTANFADGASAAVQIGGGIALGVIDGLLFSGLLLAGRREINSVEAKIRKRVKRINSQLVAQKLSLLPEPVVTPPSFLERGFIKISSSIGRWFARHQRKKNPKKSYKVAKTDIVSSTTSAASVAATADGFSAETFSLMTNVIGVLIYPIAAVCALIAYRFARRRAKRYEELQKIAKELKTIEELIDVPEISKDDTDGKRLQVFDDNWGKLEAYQKRILDLEETSKKEKLAAFVIAGVFAVITGATIYAALASIATTSTLGIVAAVPGLSTMFVYMVAGAALFMAVCPPLLLFCTIAAAALCVGAMVYKNVAGKISTATHHCMNKVRGWLGLASIDGEQHGFSAASRIRMIGAALSVVAFITTPIVGWIVGLVAAAVFGIATVTSSAYISHKEATRKNLVKEIKSSSEITKIKSTAAQVTKVFAPADAAHSVKTASIADHVAAKESSQVEGKTAPDYAARAKLGFFSPAPTSKTAAQDEQFIGRKFALGC